MGFGASVLNNFGFVLIDQDFFNLSFKYKATINSITTQSLENNYIQQMINNYKPPNFTGVFFVIDFTGINPVLAISPPVGRKLFCIHNYNAVNTNRPLYDNNIQRSFFYLEGSIPASLTYYVFDSINPTGLTNTGNGIQVLNDANQLVYHHSIPVMRAKSLVTLSGGTVGASLSMPSGRTHAYVFCNMSGGFHYTGFGNPALIKTVGFELTNLTLTTIVDIDSYELNKFGPTYVNNIVNNKSSQGFVVDVSFT
jgi:hypothetical protein